MKFYYENNMDDKGIFKEKCLVKAIYTAWNIEANLYLITDEDIKITSKNVYENSKIVFAPHENNEFNSEILESYGYYMDDGTEFREIKRIDNNNIVKYDWSEVRQLV